jgi:hypothetical protein
MRHHTRLDLLGFGPSNLVSIGLASFPSVSLGFGAFGPVFELAFAVGSI